MKKQTNKKLPPLERRETTTVESADAGTVVQNSDLAPVLFLALLPIIYLGAGLFSGTNIFGSPLADAKSQFFYTRLFGFSSLAEFSIPLWNPYVFAGTPFVGTLQSSVFYPPNLIFAILPIAVAMNWSIALHLALSGIFTYYLLRRYGVTAFGATLSGMVYTLSAPQVMHIYAGHLNALSSMAWTPLMFLLLDRMIREKDLKDSIRLGVAISLQFLAGQPQYLFYTMMALTAYLLFHLGCPDKEAGRFRMIARPLMLFVAAIAIGVGLSAIQIAPTFEMTRYSTRENLTYEWVSQFSFPPAHLITFLIPDFFGDMLKVPYWGRNYLWEMTAYVGIAPLLLAIVAVCRVRQKRVRFFAGLAAASLLLALGKFTPLLKIAYTVVPGFNLFRGNSKFIFLTAFSLAVLSGFGANLLIRTCRDKATKIVTLTAAGVAAVLVLLLLQSFNAEWFRLAINGSVLSGDFYSGAMQIMVNGFEQVAVGNFQSGAILTLGLLAATVLVLLPANFDWLDRKIVMFLLLVVVGFDLFTFGRRYMVSFDSRGAYWNQEAVEFLRKDPLPFRVMAPEMEANCGMASRIETLGGYDTIMLKRFSEYINLAQSKPPEEPDLYVNLATTNKLTDLFNVKYLLLGPNVTMDEGGPFRQVFSNGAAKVYLNRNALPRAFIVHGVKQISGKQAIFQELVKSDFDPWSYAIVDEKVPDVPDLPGERGPIPTIVSHAAERVVIDAVLSRPGLLVLGDTYYPGWKVFVDGRESKLYRANYLMRGVTLSGGRHRVEFRYEPTSFRIGALITLGTLGGAALLLARCRRRRLEQKK